ncbi:YigZ family protein [Actinocatenispora thailandica]|uniref:YigZ family protein n=1 Tax=Actinocatenispora thailandica TaxID=227318 RepID=A0A7R7DPN5_9ACTN|nr:YigZ family protein [Actinocatenispora thailandica]BCJ35503.1 YigZ family protein [Actinocatenispora thailandica]
MTTVGFRTVAADVEHDIEVKRSLFRCTLRRVADEDAARTVIAQVRRAHWDARHHCSAYVLGPAGALQRSHDDGEPAGTAGAPMLAALHGAELTDVVAVVTRWFGGVLLGTGGLARAYRAAVTGAIESAGVLVRRPVTLLAVAADHAHAGGLEHAVRAADPAAVRAVDYTADGVRLALAVPPERVDALRTLVAEQTAGTGSLAETGSDFADA